MAKNKEAELEKYLDKKKRQKLRDDIMHQIAELSKNDCKDGISRIKKKIAKKKAAEASFESKLSCKEDDEIPGTLHTPELAEDDDSTLNTDDTTLNTTATLNTVDHPTLNTVDSTLNTAATLNTVDHPTLNTTATLNTTGQEGNHVPLPFETINRIGDQPKPEKDLILALNEQFIPHRFTRTEEIISQRNSMAIVYEEAEIVSRIKYSTITFIQGETGCGKTTQIPQFLYENGLAFDKMIALTQPRRFSAISISGRINHEANEDIAGYKIKYENNIKKHTKIKVLTEGVLLREIQSDFLLQQYSVVILDEVHERSTNMDVLVGLLSRIVRIRLEQKTPLRLVLMSATTNPDVFRSVLDRFDLINLTGKMYPVSVFYEDKTSDDYLDVAYKKVTAILDSEQKYISNRKSKLGNASVPTAIENSHKASILVFLTSKEDIYRLKDRLDPLGDRVVVLPLHSGLNKKEQAVVYDRFPVRKIVLATNIAETSITIDDIVFVIDCGREKKKVAEGSVIMYKTDFVSKSSAKQRMGRAGRTGPGVCYRLYSGDTYESFTEHSQPQIFTEPIDSTLLLLKCMGIRNLFGFPFIDQPPETAISEALGALETFGALSKDWAVTKLGRRMCCYPVSPRYARFLAVHRKLPPAVFTRLVAVTAILSCGLELRRHEGTAEYFQDATSDLIVLLRIFVAYLRAKNKRRHASEIRISVEKLEEVRKMGEYLLRISDVEGDLSPELTRDEEADLGSYLYYLFADQLAVSCGDDSYIFGEDEVWISKDSVDTRLQNVVFDYAVRATKKLYIKNVTVVPISISRPS